MLTDLEAKCKFAKQNVSESCSNSLHYRRWPAIPADSALTSAESPSEAGSLVREVGSAETLYVKNFFLYSLGCFGYCGKQSLKQMKVLEIRLKAVALLLYKCLRYRSDKPCSLCCLKMCTLHCIENKLYICILTIYIYIYLNKYSSLTSE